MSKLGMYFTLDKANQESNSVSGELRSKKITSLNVSPSETFFESK